MISPLRSIVLHQFKAWARIPNPQKHWRWWVNPRSHKSKMSFGRPDLIGVDGFTTRYRLFRWAPPSLSCWQIFHGRLQDGLFVLWLEMHEDGFVVIPGKIGSRNLWGGSRIEFRFHGEISNPEPIICWLCLTLSLYFKFIWGRACKKLCRPDFTSCPLALRSLGMDRTTQYE